MASSPSRIDKQYPFAGQQHLTSQVNMAFVDQHFPSFPPDRIMLPATIIIPVFDFEQVERYYKDVLLFEQQEDLFFLPNGSRDVALKLMIVDATSREASPPRRHFPIFSFAIPGNFLSYCDTLRSRGAVFESVLSHPGGYYARVSDPEGNQFEIECDNFDESNEVSDPWRWPFYKRY